jgi:hypothetical protein
MPDSSATRPEPPRPFWLRVPLIIVLVLGLTLLRAMISNEVDLLGDEAYYTFWSLAPAAGYYDHPPLIAWLIAAGRSLVGEGNLGVRTFALVAPAVISLAMYRTGSLLMDRTTGLLAVLWYNLSIGVSLSMLATPDAPSTLFWMLAAWAVAEFIASRNANWWLAVGLFAGLGVLGKYTVLFFGAGVALFILTSRERWLWLKLPQLWLGGFLALLVVSPNLIWNAQNGWITFGFQGGRIANDPTAADIAYNYLDLVGGQALFLGPLVVLFFLIAAILLIVRPRRWGALAWPVLGILPAVIYFAIHASRAHVEANWLLPLWPMACLAAAYVVLRCLRASLPLRLVGHATVYAQTLLGLLLTAGIQWVIFTHPPGLEHLDRTRDMRGWHEAARQLDAIATERGASWIAVPASYGTVGLFGTYSHFIGIDRPVISIGDRFRYRFAPVDAEALTFPTVLVNWSNDPNYVAGLFGFITPVGTIERRFRKELMASYQILEVSEPTPQFYEQMR